MEKRKHKIFIGFENISSTVSDMKRFFIENGHTCYFALRTRNSNIIINEADIILNEAKFKKLEFLPKKISDRIVYSKNRLQKFEEDFFTSASNDFDTFIFIWSSFRSDFSDLEKLKKKGKKIIFIFVGDDVRWQYSANQEFKHYGLKSKIIYDSSIFYSKQYLEHNLIRMRMAEKYADAIFSRLDQSQLQIRPYHRWNMMVDAREYKNLPDQNKVPNIIHAPSSFIIKGSHTIIEVINRLKKDGLKFNFTLIENMDHIAFKEKLKGCDILIDQLIIPGTGKISTEALAFGKLVLSNMSYDKYPQKNPQDCPIIDVNEDTLYDILKDLIPNQKKRNSISARSNEYVRKHLDISSFCNKVIDIIENKPVELDYHPQFFTKHFEPENEEMEAVYTQSLSLIHNESWYSEPAYLVNVRHQRHNQQ